MNDALLQTQVPGHEPFHAGKVRDLFRHEGQLILVTTDRVSAYDVIMPTGIPGRGIILTQLSKFWFERMEDLCTNHLVSTELEDLPEPFQLESLRGRTMLANEVEIIPFECVIRGYLAGSGWREYQDTGEVCGIKLADGLGLSEKLPQPIFTPATKAVEGHDENISEAFMANEIGEELTGKLRDLSIAIYSRAADFARERGLILADTKFEFGMRNGEIVLADEVLSPDSSRYWPVDGYAAGRRQQEFDKQYLRNYLETLDWDKTAPGPELPGEIVQGVQSRYLEAYRILTGTELSL